ncbi:MAG: ZIP family metal transporter [Planctomycetota bacterium]
MMFGLVVVFSLIGSVCSTAVAGAVLLIREESRREFVPYVVCYATGTLLGAAFLGLLPHALIHAPVEVVCSAVLAGIVLFFILEKMAMWRHCHDRDCKIHPRAGVILLIGDSMHNFVDGVAIAAAFAGSIPLGIATALAVAAHEIPQEVGDFAVLLESGYAPGRAFRLNLLSSAFTLVGAVPAWLLLPSLWGVLPVLMSLSAASFIYIALADLVPGHRRETGLASTVSQVVLILLGVGTIALFQAWRHGS